MSEAHDDVQVTPLEILFDIVFAFTTTQLTSLLTTGFAATGQIVLILLMLFWMYGGYVWLMNQVPVSGLKHRLLLVLGMGGFLICALAIPEVFSGEGVVFALGYLVVVLVHTGLYASALGADARLFAPFNIVGALALIVAGVIGGTTAYILWIVVLVLQIISARLAGRVTNRPEWHIHAGHFVERHQALLLIVIGESVIATGIGIEGMHLDANVVLAVSAGFALAAALWWAHFDVDEPLGTRAMVNATRERMLQIAIGAYLYAYTVMFLGIIATAAGVRLSIARFESADSVEGAAFLAGGVALYLIGDALYRAVCGLRPIGTRLAAAVLAASTYAVGVTVSTGAQVVTLLVLVVAVLIVEATRFRTRLIAA